MEFKLRKWESKDADDVAWFANNKKIADKLRNAFPYPYTIEDARWYVNNCANDPEEYQICRAIEVGGHAVGSIGVFCGTDVFEKNGELGYWLGEPYWKNGIMTQATRQICTEAFEKLDIMRIFAEPFAKNMGSRKVLEHAGFSFEGTMRNGVFKNGEVLDYCMYALLREA